MTSFKNATSVKNIIHNARLAGSFRQTALSDQANEILLSHNTIPLGQAMYLASAPLPGTSRPKPVQWGWGLACAPLPQPTAARSAQVSPAGAVPKVGFGLRPFWQLPPPPRGRFCLGFQGPAFDGPPSSSVGANAARQQLIAKATNILNSGWETSTSKTYEQRLRVSVHGAEHTVDSELLPVDTSDKLIILFTTMAGMPWSTVRLNKAAVRAWHSCRGLLSVFDEAWDDKALHFWKGLKKHCINVPGRKRALDVEELAAFVQSRLSADTPAGIRDAAMGVFCFFGVRRASEGILLLRSEISVHNSHLEAFIRRQKNDPAGRGQRCWIPRGAPLAVGLNPAQIIERWIAWWDERFPEQPTDAPLFCVTRGDVPKALSYDSWRKAGKSGLSEAADVSTHSFRRGGAMFYLHSSSSPASEEAVQAQGGWADAAFMRAVYAKTPESTVRNQLIGAWTAEEPRSPSDAQSSGDLATDAKRQRVK